MNKFSVKLLLVVLMNMLLLNFVNASEVELTKNPFVNPFNEKGMPSGRNLNTEIINTLLDSNLRATLTSEEHSIANVDGTMVFLGEKIKGYELISVGVGTATFKKDEKEITLSVTEMHEKLK